MKRFLNIAAALMFAISIQAQKIDARLTALLPSNYKMMSKNTKGFVIYKGKKYLNR